MARGFWLAALVVAGLAGAFWGARWYTADGPETTLDTGTDQICQPLEQRCQWQTSAGEAVVTMAAAEDDGRDELILDVTLPEVSGPVIVVLTGEHMYMGEYPLRLESTATPDQYQARFVPPFCSTGDDMVWRIDLRIGQDPVNLPFRLVFPAAAN